MTQKDHREGRERREGEGMGSSEERQGASLWESGEAKNMPLSLSSMRIYRQDPTGDSEGLPTGLVVG